MTAEEVAQVPRKPKRKKVHGKTYHGSWCIVRGVRGQRGHGRRRDNQVGTDHDQERRTRWRLLTWCSAPSHYSLTFFPDQFREYSKLIRQQTAFLVSGQKNDRGQITVNEIVDVVELAAGAGLGATAAPEERCHASAARSSDLFKGRRRGCQEGVAYARRPDAAPGVHRLGEGRAVVGDQGLHRQH